MTKRFRKILSILCVLALLVSCAAIGFAAEELPEGTETTLETNGTEAGNEAPAEVPEEDGEEEETPSAVVEDVEFPETDPAGEPAEEEKPAPAPSEPETTEVVSEPVTIQDAVEEAAENKDNDQPAEGTTPAQEETPAQVETPVQKETPAQEETLAQEETPAQEEAPVQEDNEEEINTDVSDNNEEEGEPVQDSEDKEPPEEPEEPKDEAEEAVYMDLDVKKDVSGILTKSEPFAVIAADAYSRTVIFTLTVSEEDAVSVTLNDKPVILEKQENPNPLSTDVVYTFEKQMLQNQVYSILLKTEREEYVPFTLSMEEKKVTIPEQEETSVLEENEEESNTDTSDNIEEEKESAQDSEEKKPAVESEDEPDNAVYMDLDVKEDVSGILTKSKSFAVIVADAYSRTVIFTLTVSEEDAVSVTLNDKPVTLEKQENPDPLSTDVIYTFERQLLQNQVYSISLATEREGYVPFTLKMEEKKEPAAEKPQETPEETIVEEEKTEETDSGLKDEETVSEAENEFPEEFTIHFEVTWDGDQLYFGDIAHFVATVSGDENLDYTILWQWSTDNENWVSIEDEHEMQMDVRVTEENYLYYWRVKAELVAP